jgi:hypothetical protein
LRIVPVENLCGFQVDALEGADQSNDQD